MLSAQDNAVYAAIVGLLAHRYYQRYEPTLSQFCWTFAGCSAVTAARLIYQADLTLDTRQAVSILRQLCALQITYLISLSLSILYYRLISPSHPLHAVPGPVLAKASQLWYLRLVQSDRAHSKGLDLVKKYGPTVRIGPNELLCADDTEVMKILGANCWEKGPACVCPDQERRALMSRQLRRRLDAIHRRT